MFTYKDFSCLNLLAYLFTISLLTGCSETVVSSGYQNQSTVQVILTPRPAKILNENNLKIQLADANATVKVTLSMPGMDHGDLVVGAISEGNGTYVAKIIPVMVGTWIAKIDIEKNGSTTNVSYTFEAVR